MSDGDKLETEMIKGGVELIKTAYTDAFQPIAQETGKTLGTFGRAVNVALSPLRGVVWSFEQIEEFVSNKVTAKLEQKGVSEDKITTPDPDIAVPAVEALRYSKLKDEYASLIATSIDKDNANKAHPAYVEILKQLQPDEAKMLKILGLNQSHPFIELIFKAKNRKLGIKKYGFFFDSLFEKAELDFSNNLVVYIDNLKRLGLLSVPENGFLTAPNIYDSFWENKAVKNFKDMKLDGYSPDYKKRYMTLSVLGASFKTACLY